MLPWGPTIPKALPSHPKALPFHPQLASSPGQVAHGLYNALSPGIAPPVTQRALRPGGGEAWGGGETRLLVCPTP